MDNDERYQEGAAPSEHAYPHRAKDDLVGGSVPGVDDEGETNLKREQSEVPENPSAVEDVVAAAGERQSDAGEGEVGEDLELDVTDTAIEDEPGDGARDVEGEISSEGGIPDGAAPPVLVRSRGSGDDLILREREGRIRELPIGEHRFKTRRDLLLFGIGSIAAVRGLTWVLPASTQMRMGIKNAQDSATKEALLNRALRFDDDVAEALQSARRNVRTYGKHQITELKNNYAGMTPDPSYIPDWRLTLSGLASGSQEVLSMRSLRAMFPLKEQITRLICVEGWSAVAWWDGFPFSELLRVFPPMSQARFAKVESGVNLDTAGNPDPYYVSLDLATARHPQTLFATHFKGAELEPEHGAPLRLIAPMKLGLKNVKAITSITYTAEEPADYWAERGYSRFDGL